MSRCDSDSRRSCTISLMLQLSSRAYCLVYEIHASSSNLPSAPIEVYAYNNRHRSKSCAMRAQSTCCSQYSLLTGLSIRSARSENSHVRQSPTDDCTKASHLCAMKKFNQHPALVARIQGGGIDAVDAKRYRIHAAAVRNILSPAKGQLKPHPCRRRSSQASRSNPSQQNAGFVSGPGRARSKGTPRRPLSRLLGP